MQDIEQAYRRLLERYPVMGSAAAEADERRNHPRFGVPAREILIKSEFSVPALDVSLSGIAFRSQFPIETGSRLTVQVANAISGEAIVVACEPERGDGFPAQPMYRVRCNFAEDTMGMPLVVVLNDNGVGGPPRS